MTDLFPEVAPRNGVEDENQRFTTRETLDWCEDVAGVDGWDLDVAACEESHKGPCWYGWKPSKEFSAASGIKTLDNGLNMPWFGQVWCNPPFDDVWAWVDKAWLEMQAERCDVVALLMPANRTEQAGWQTSVEPWRDGRDESATMSQGVSLSTHFLPGRTKFGHPGNPEGVGVGSPPFGCVLLVWRRA